MAGYERGNRSSLRATTDGQIYDYFQRRRQRGRDAPVMDALAFRIHDHAIDDALHGLLYPDDAPNRQVVGVMGGHQMARTDPRYRQVADVAWTLAQDDVLVATGGGPGAMEAANLGAYLSRHDRAALDDAIDRLAAAPNYEDAAYLDRALDVRDRYPDGHESLAVPTWFYGHEPTNLFARHVAKYFANSIREDGLLAIANQGVVYAPGSAGTIQEVFMDAAQNHYETFGAASPMVFLDTTYWTETKPVYPLLKTLAADAEYGTVLACHDEADAVVDFIRHHAAPTRGEQG
jgi:predicted Rossmann-fold nucleotide-binding protein